MNNENKKHKLWGGRFAEETNKTLERLNASISYDKRMWGEDIKGSEAYAKCLLKAGLLTSYEAGEIIRGLNEVKDEWKQNLFLVQPSDEDIHTAIERRLTELIGAPAMKLHTGRSRNDQVITDMRLWMKSAILKLHQILTSNIHQFTARASREMDILFPGYTHLQRAQPIRWSHWLLSYCWNLKSDCERLHQLYERVDVLPLGSGALSGNPFHIDRQFLADELGFERVSQNSMHAVGDRDFVAEFLFWASLTSVHLSRLAEDLVLYSSKEFGFVSIADGFSTGSSLMPQKRNADSLELIRGRAGRIFGQCCGFMMTLKGLPSTYNKDLQEDKEAMFNVFDSLEAVLDVVGGVISTLKVMPQQCRAALSPDMLATDIAYYLVKKDVPFREAHHLAGQVVATAEKENRPITDLSLQELQAISNCFEEDIKEIWSYEHSAEQYQVTGGTSKFSVKQQIDDLLQWVSKVTLE